MSVSTEVQYFEVNQDLANNMLFHVTGFLMELGTTNPVVGRTVSLYVDDSGPIASTATLPQPPGIFNFDYTFLFSGDHTIQVKFLGDAQYSACESTKETVTAGVRTPTTIVNFTAVEDGLNPFRYYVTGSLIMAGTQFGLNNEAIHLFVSGAEVANELTHSDVGEGYFDFDYTFTETGPHYLQAKYYGSTQFTASESTTIEVDVTVVPSSKFTYVDYPTQLFGGEIGHVKGFYFNNGQEPLPFWVKMYDSIGNTLAIDVPESPTQPGASGYFDLSFTMPNENLDWYIELTDAIYQNKYDRDPDVGTRKIYRIGAEFTGQVIYPSSLQSGATGNIEGTFKTSAVLELFIDVRDVDDKTPSEPLGRLIAQMGPWFPTQPDTVYGFTIPIIMPNKELHWNMVLWGGSTIYSIYPTVGNLTIELEQPPQIPQTNTFPPFPPYLTENFVMVQDNAPPDQPRILREDLTYKGTAFPLGTWQADGVIYDTLTKTILENTVFEESTIIANRQGNFHSLGRYQRSWYAGDIGKIHFEFTTPIDITQYETIVFSHYNTGFDNPFIIYFEDETGGLSKELTWDSAAVWQESIFYTTNFSNTGFDATKVKRIHIRASGLAVVPANYYLDWMFFYRTPIEGQIRIDSNPSGRHVDITLQDGTVYHWTTSAVATSPEGYPIKIKMLDDVPTDKFLYWEDDPTNTNPERTEIVESAPKTVKAIFTSAETISLVVRAVDKDGKIWGAANALEVTYGSAVYADQTIPWGGPVRKGTYSFKILDLNDRTFDHWTLPDASTSTEQIITINAQSSGQILVHWKESQPVTPPTDWVKYALIGGIVLFIGGTLAVASRSTSSESKQ